MSFKCEACGLNKAGSAIPEVCEECRPTQLGRATLLVFDLSEGFDSNVIRQLEEVVGEAQNAPPEGKADGTISRARWERFRALTASARAYDMDLERALRFP